MAAAYAPTVFRPNSLIIEHTLIIFPFFLAIIFFYYMLGDDKRTYHVNGTMKRCIKEVTKNISLLQKELHGATFLEIVEVSYTGHRRALRTEDRQHIDTVISSFDGTDTNKWVWKL